MLKTLDEKRLDVKKTMEIIQEEQRLEEEKEVEARELRQQAEAELATALPALEEADRYFFNQII